MRGKFSTNLFNRSFISASNRSFALKIKMVLKLKFNLHIKTRNHKTTHDD
jgi:hypothetical protein